MGAAHTNTYPLLGEERLTDELGAWLGGHRWNHFVTLTYHYSARGDRQFYRWIRRLEQLAGRSVQFAMFSELTTAGFLHHHALVFGTGGLPANILRESWTSGRSDVQVYDPERGASHYICKRYGKDELAFPNLSAQMPPTA
ncbi:hypothetical protein Strain138_001939 [Pseudogemmatithrix spongiicola]|uniref:Replication-associated protein ORF2/G2P domain-containing protein n=1 Tax=Pseudogemmatithrix spongiicola TaxID=3062599 RepID=A0AA49Q5A9_9BACT|nr:hypothetical protein Strain138_001939 [Gemmatimonadaceae bacterium 'strain 138']WKW15548.1 hypothetical protein Strain318_001938 [Gemmatimonadaceae bacterium 'strain 318']